MLNATSPFFAVIAGAVWLAQPVTRTKLAGITLGMVGVVVLVGLQPGAASNDVLLAVAACLVAAICYALAGVYTKRALSDVPSHAIACASQVVAALALMPLLPFTTIPGPLTALVVANVAGLAIGSTAIAYLIYFKLIADVGPAARADGHVPDPAVRRAVGRVVSGRAADTQPAHRRRAGGRGNDRDRA